jgi:hypothetical protein
LAVFSFQLKLEERRTRASLLGAGIFLAEEQISGISQEAGVVGYST